MAQDRQDKGDAGGQTPPTDRDLFDGTGKGDLTSTGESAGGSYANQDRAEGIDGDHSTPR